jgi:hypothetical protein
MFVPSERRIKRQNFLSWTDTKNCIQEPSLGAMFKHSLRRAQGVRHKSLWESVTGLLARDKQEKEMPAAVKADEDMAVVGKAVPGRNRVIGFDIGAPVRLYGPELQTSLQETFKACPDASGLELAQRITTATGRRVPDVVLNKDSRSAISKYFELNDKDAAQAAKLRLPETLPGNIRTK